MMNADDRIVQILDILVAQDTRSKYKRESNLRSQLTTILTESGFDTKVILTDSRPNILADNRKAGKAILFYGHIDTVDVVSGWTKDPFKLLVEGHKAYGLGAYDMKGGMAAFLTAIKNINKHVKVMLAVDEENISAGAWDIAEKQKSFFDDVEIAVSAEPNFGLGMHGITVGRTGRVIFNVVSVGKPVHIAKFRDGLNAIYPLADFIAKLKRSRLTNDKMTVIQPRSVRSEVTGMSLCERAEVDIEVLLGGDDNIDDVREKLQTVANESGGNITVKLAPRVTPYLTGYCFEKFPYQDEISKIIKKFTNEKMKLCERSSVGDDNVIASLGIPIITWGPDGGGAHEADEWVDLESLQVLANMYKALIES